MPSALLVLLSFIDYLYSMIPKLYGLISFCFLAVSLAFSQPDRAAENTPSVAFLSSPEEAMKARLWAIGMARKEILVSYYIFEDDGFGMLFLQEMVLAKIRNPDLNIRILVDASANGLSTNLIHHLGQQGIEIKEYHPLPKFWVPYSHISAGNFFTALRNLNRRLHDKILLVDSVYLICGGRNIEESYFGMEEKNFHDLDILIHSGKLGFQTASYFSLLWESDHVQGICPAIDYSSRDNYNYDIARFEGLKNYIHNHPEYRLLRAEAIFPDKEVFALDTAILLCGYCPVSREFEPQKLSSQFRDILLTTREELLIETPYLLLTDDLFDVLKALRSRNVRIGFITNSYCSTDVTAIAGVYDARKKELLEIGVELYEYGGTDYLHGKCMVIDRETGIVGSYNIDPRSANINSEMMILFRGRDAVIRLESILMSDITRCDQIELINGKVTGGFYDCHKSTYQSLLYFVFRGLSGVQWIYNLL